MKRVFISYARATPAELEAARWLAGRLRRAPAIARVFLDDESFVPGSPLRRTLIKEIESADAVVFLISRTFSDRDYTTQELLDTARADPTGEIIHRIPVHRCPSEEIKEPPAEVSRFGRAIPWVDGTDDPEAALWKIYCGIMGDKEPGEAKTHHDAGAALGTSDGEPAEAPPLPVPVCDSLECGRELEWGDVEGDSRVHDRVIIVGGLRGEDHEHFVRRIRRCLPHDPPRSFVFVNWATDMGMSAQPRIREDYLECLGRALMPGRHLDRRGLLAVLRKRLRESNLIVVHPRVDSISDDDHLLEYYRDWLPELLRELEPARHHVKLVQPVAWSTTNIVPRFLRGMFTLWRRTFISPLDFLCGAEERLARRVARSLKKADKHCLLAFELSRIRRKHVDAFCDRKVVPDRDRDEILERIARVRTSHEVFAKIDDVLARRSV